MLTTSFRAEVRARNGLLYGGRARHRSSRFGTRELAVSWAEVVCSINDHVETDYVILVADEPPEIYQHCEGAAPQAVGFACPKCGAILPAPEGD